ncbi:MULTISPECIES: hypothetical protein [Acidithrix]|jgi:hypothetical protein|uniref:Uncharacterized protein n=1 Tax=Acidithrix ferrooxidans TaxID=1280514 RepID=A0A0D8HEZ4_9ACTN|nr:MULTISPECIES: hypothetical protein [Acidithrix]KJF16493.1 hypothetical protein AXFE_26580 [Acidithrix ferrooxidans]CAG4928934.1 unnamed protein product [Acidithrix sp. C25]
MSLINQTIIKITLLVGDGVHWLSQWRDRYDFDEAGEGVVSAAIAVLIFAFLGVILWVAFKATMGTATNTINAQVAKLGQ